MITLQIANNLFIQKNKVISYETHVANILDSYIVELGKYSRTTGKHIHKIASYFNLQVIRSDNKKSFHKYQTGIEPFKMKNALKPKISIQLIKSGIDLSSVKNEDLWNFIIENKDYIGKQDWDVFKQILKLPETTPNPRLEKFKWESL